MNTIADKDFAIAHAVCHALGLPVRNPQTSMIHPVAIDDAAIVLTHKLRWHDGTSNEAAEQPQTNRPRMRRPHFAATNSPKTSLTLFAQEE
ncbi:MAG: hypothetical protein WKF77_15550 [Planctomycetaceae bacterium]